MNTEKNIRIYPWYQAAAGFLPWMPVFFLYFSQTVSLDKAIELGAIYYLAVVIFEVPSGYFSDRFGRRTTLLCAAVFALASYSVFLFASAFTWFAMGQILLAGAIAFQSGSDSSLLYDSLTELNRQQDYEAHEARSQQFGMTSLAISVI
ncbi:MAG: MFS transporter, partial [Pseudomonadota bacterium]